MDYKLIKYLYKYSLSDNEQYFKKICKYSNIQTGGKIIEFISKDDDNIETTKKSLLEFINKTMDGLEKNKFKNKYVVILIGPPGAGKTLARHVGITKIINSEDDKDNKDGQKTDYYFNTFIDISVDDYVAGVIVKDDDSSHEELLHEAKTSEDPTHKTITGKNMLEREVGRIVLEAKKINQNGQLYNDDFYNKTFEVYKKLRDKVDSLSFIMLYLSTYLGANIFFETLGDLWILKEIVIAFCDATQYIPVIVYPYIVSYEQVADRIHKRGKTEYRYMSKTNVDNAIRIADHTYELIKQQQIENTKLKNHKQILMIKYNAIVDLTPDEISINNVDRLMSQETQ